MLVLCRWGGGGGGVPSTFVVERSVVFVRVRSVAVVVQKIFSKSHASRKIVDVS